MSPSKPNVVTLDQRRWPTPIGAAGYQGPIGEYVAAVEPHSEGDPSAILVQTLVVLGNVAGREPHFYIEDDRHSTALNVAVVGGTSRARKGTSLGRAMALGRVLDTDWALHNEGEAGLSTPEGLIYAVRDAAQDGDGQFKGGADEKRFCAIASEFGEVLSKMKREGNPLGATLRTAWDGRTLRTRTRSSPLVATEYHVSVIAHITEEELSNALTAVDIYNGFGNRFLWVMARRSKSLPRGGDFRVEEDMAPFIEQLARNLDRSTNKERVIEFDRPAERYWGERLYDELGDSQAPGRAAAMTDRAEAQVRRIALVYAVVEGQTKVRSKHLEAAAEVWRYCEDSAIYLFADEARSPVGAKLLALLQARPGDWVPLEKLSRLTKGKIASFRMRAALEELERAGAVESRRVPTGGRPRHEYIAQRKR